MPEEFVEGSHQFFVSGDDQAIDLRLDGSAGKILSPQAGIVRIARNAGNNGCRGSRNRIEERLAATEAVFGKRTQDGFIFGSERFARDHKAKAVVQRAEQRLEHGDGCLRVVGRQTHLPVVAGFAQRRLRLARRCKFYQLSRIVLLYSLTGAC